MSSEDSSAGTDDVELLPTQAGDGVDFFDRATKNAWDRIMGPNGLLDPLQRLYKVDEDTLNVRYNNRPNMINPNSRFIVFKNVIVYAIITWTLLYLPFQVDRMPTCKTFARA